MPTEELNNIPTSILKRSPILEIAQNCLMLEELEISFFKESFHYYLSGPLHINGEDLCYIAQFKMLRKLTLGDFDVNDGVFLEEVRARVLITINNFLQLIFFKIISKCTMLESLRLSNLGSPDLCCYLGNLCASLHQAKNLTLLRYDICFCLLWLSFTNAHIELILHCILSVFFS